MLENQTNPVGVQLFSYVNTFFCHVGLPNQSCAGSTLFLCYHFLWPCCCTKPILWEFNSFLMLTLSFVIFVYQTNPEGVELFSYVNIFFCHVVVPNQSCESSTLFLCKHFVLSCCCTKPILWELNSFLILTLSFAMLLYQTNPVRVQLFSYANTFFCHVVVPNQSCGSSTLFLC